MRFLAASLLIHAVLCWSAGSFWQPKADVSVQSVSGPRTMAIEIEASSEETSTTLKKSLPAQAARPSTSDDSVAASSAPIDPYLSQVRAEIRSELKYPLSLRRRAITGTVLIQIKLRPDGTLAGIELLRSSGHAELDQLARESIERANPFQPVPLANASDGLLVLELPIDFKLSQI